MAQKPGTGPASSMQANNWLRIQPLGQQKHAVWMMRPEDFGATALPA